MPKQALLGLALAAVTLHQEEMASRCAVRYEVCISVDCASERANANYILCKQACERHYLACMSEVYALPQDG